MLLRCVPPPRPKLARATGGYSKKTLFSSTRTLSDTFYSLCLDRPWLDRDVGMTRPPSRGEHRGRGGRRPNLITCPADPPTFVRLSSGETAQSTLLKSSRYRARPRPGYSPAAASPATTFGRGHLDAPTTETPRVAITALRFLLTYFTGTLSCARRPAGGGVCDAARGRERTTSERRGGGGARRRVAPAGAPPAVGPTGRNGVALFAAARRRRCISREYPSSPGLGHGRDDVFLIS
ncbi:hypothetical protein EVAR_45553_1 [Eumeta japonica]|uniref:Uncharacterized protein n=1 Tax=Eumeta variegata TaxID=151549 RepID=A0A4C1X870_EUMVA|nr:hypothetical protein EVAR_45553_1 [Eumeta japonica]